MLYKKLDTQIPQEKRAEINDKILHIIHTNTAEQYNITKEVIYNSYTGDGGLSGVNRSDYNSFYEYTKAKQEFEQGQFFTPHNIAKYMINSLQIPANSNVIDLSCGAGVFFNFINNSQCFGNEIDNKALDVCRYLYPNVNLALGDMLYYKSDIKMDYCVGNPPFNLDMRYKGAYQKSQMVYIQLAESLLKKSGILCIIVPTSFLADEFSNKSDIEYMNENFTFIGQEQLNSKTFSDVGVENFNTKIIAFAKKSEFIEDVKYTNTFSNIKEELAKFQRQVNKHKSNIILENRKIHKLSDEFEFKVKKYLFDINRNVSAKYFEAKNLVHKFYNQQKPDNVSSEEWEKVKLTEDKVLRQLKQIISEQHGKKWGKKHITSTKEDLKQSIPFDDLPIDKDIEEFLTQPIIDVINNKEIRLNPIQLEIVNKMLQKKYGYIQSSQGTGKTLMSIFYALYRKETKNTLVIAPSLAINTTWSETLEKYNIPFINIKSYSDLNKINLGKFIIISFEMLNKYVKKLKKQLSQNITLILDEADSICNINSVRSKSVLSVGSKARYKLLLSGTMTRNNITEAFTQFLLLYGSSANFISTNRYILSEDVKTKELIDKLNPFYNQNYPHYKRGLKLFQESFNPRKITVFGAEQNTQEVYNPDDLKILINKTIITKTFEQVVGKDLYKIIQHNISMNEGERELYKKVIEEFYSMKHLFTSTGNARKDRMMEIIQQINLLLNVCRHPNTYKEYNSTETPSKYNKVLELCREFENERVAIGTRTLKEVEEYSKILSGIGRNVYIITGATSMNKRQEIIEELKNDVSGILLSTQQSLSVSIDIDFIDKVLISSLPWNWSTLSQYFFRFVRYTSQNNKQIHIITYENSLENNLLYLISQKENLTNFMKNDEDVNILDRLGVDYNLIDMLLIKTRTKEGVKITSKNVLTNN